MDYGAVLCYSFKSSNLAILAIAFLHEQLENLQETLDTDMAMRWEVLQLHASFVKSVSLSQVPDAICGKEYAENGMLMIRHE